MNKITFLKNLLKKRKKPELNIKILNSRIYQKYTEYLIEYNVEISERVKSYILIPKIKNNQKMPAVVCYHQHASKYNIGKSQIVGKKSFKHLAYAKELAELGFVTIAIDSIGFEDRNWNHNNKSWWGIEYYELVSRIVKGENLFNKILHDTSCAISALTSFEVVDKKNIGFIGHSFGGRVGLFISSYDKRVKASFSNCYCVRISSNMIKDNQLRLPMELCIPNISKYIDIEDIIKIGNNSNLYISVSKNDKWSKDGKYVFENLKKSFAKNKLFFKEWKYGHTFNKTMRIEAYKFLRRKLCVE